MTYVRLSSTHSCRLSRGCTARSTMRVKSRANPSISATNKTHDANIDANRAQGRAEMRPSAPARSIRLFTRLTPQTSHDALRTFEGIPAPAFMRRSRRAESERRGAKTRLASATYEDPAEAPEATRRRAPRVPPRPFASTPFASIAPASRPLSLSVSSSSTSSSLENGSSAGLSCAVIILSAAILEIMSVLVTGHTTSTRIAEYSTAPSPAERISGT